MVYASTAPALSVCAGMRSRPAALGRRPTPSLARPVSPSHPLGLLLSKTYDLVSVTAAQVNSSATDRIEDALRNKVESASNFNDNPTQALATVFRKLDINSSGKLSVGEFQAAMKKLNFNDVDRELAALFSRYDLDRSGYLDIKCV